MTHKFEVREEAGGRVAIIELPLDDVYILHGALRETGEALEDWEFETRMGVPRARMIELLQFLSHGLREATEASE